MLSIYDKSEKYEDLHDVISLWMYKATQNKIDKFLNSLDCNDIKLYLYSDNDKVNAAIAIKLLNEKDIEIKGIAVSAEFQKNGIGSKMIDSINIKYPKMNIFAETDDDAVVFYKKNGFTCKLLPNKYPGINRYLCVK